MKHLTLPYPAWICHECGVKYGKRIPDVATWSEGTCGICQCTKSVTEPRDYGHIPTTPAGGIKVDADDVILEPAKEVHA